MSRKDFTLILRFGGALDIIQSKMWILGQKFKAIRLDAWYVYTWEIVEYRQKHARKFKASKNLVLAVGRVGYLTARAMNLSKVGLNKSTIL